MKIAIFGDSFGKNRAANNKGTAWTDFLEEKFSTKNFCISGSSLLYTKKIFDLEQEKYDKIIFLITQPGRCYITLDTEIESLKHISGARKIERNLKDPRLSYDDKQIIKIYRDYFMFVKNWDDEKYVHNLIIKDIITQRPDTVLIPCFLDSMENVEKSLFCVSKHDLLNFTDDEIHSIIDTRPCHLTDKYNLILFKEVKNAVLKNLSSINFNSFY